jgi:outer membrane receptor protein involved in Fe transport
MKSRLLASSVFAGAAFMAQANMLAIAQEADEAVDTVETTTEDATARQQTVYVTGSRIASPNMTNTSPVSSVSAEDIKLQGVTRVEDLVTQLPQAFAAQNSTVANGASGTATVSLRNLGSTRTLVLIDGKRMPYGSPNDPAADLNLIPGQLVERVDVLTGGASAVYGSDAIAGVVNFIMKDDFEGIQIDTQYGFYQHSNDYDTNGNLRDVIAQRGQTNPSQFKLPDDNVIDGYSKEITAIMGLNTDDGRGNLTAWFGYRSNDAVLQANRDYSACAIGSSSATGFTCGGSATSYPGYFFTADGGEYSLDETTGNTFRPYTDDDLYNYGPLNYYQRPDTRYSVGFNGHYQVNDYVEAYGQFMFMDYESIAQIAPTGNFFSTSNINCDNPLLSSSQAADIGCTADMIENGGSPDFFYMARRNVEGGGRRDNLGYQTYRGVAGIRGDLFNASGWTYDLSASYSQVTMARSYTNEFSVARLTQALDVIEDPDTGEAVCRDSSNGCVPYDVFTIGGVTQDALDFLQVPLLQNGTTTQNIVSGVISGDMGQYGWQLPTASSGLQVAFGVEYRRDSLESITDNSFATGDGAGQGGPTIGLSGAIDAYEVFGEFQLPLVEGKPGVELLSVEGAYRYSDYSTGISSDAYKIGGDYAPTSDIRFRASYQKAVRAPNVIDLFEAQGFNLFDIDDDLCDFTDPEADGIGLAQYCVNDDPNTRQPWQVSQAQADSGFLDSPAGQYNQLVGGDPGLDPEEADTFTVGFVATPSFLPGFTASLDYYDIEITDAISTVGASVTMQLCYLQGDMDACNRISRNPNGQLWVGTGNVENLTTNIGGVKTSGVDVSMAYGMDINTYGSLNFSLNGTWLDSMDWDPVGNPAYEYSCVGMYGNDCGTPTPEWRHRARVSWVTPWDGLDLSATWRYLGEVDLDTGATGKVDSTLDAQNYFDLAGQWAAKDWVSFRFGVNNVLDEDPPLSASAGTTGNGNTYPQSYDALGRYFFVGATFDF